MPDVANALKFQKKLTAVETDYLRQINAYRRETRRVLLEILDRDGVSRAGVSAMVREIDGLSRRVSATASLTARDARTVVQNYMQKQLQFTRRAGLTNTQSLSPVLAQGQQAAQDGEQAYMTNTSAWLSQLETSIQTNAARLRISSASREEAVDRLLSETARDGRASVWVASGNVAQTEETANLWTYGVGLLGAYMFHFNETEESNFQKQAIATIDERTTDCCLRVHGQVQPIDEPFELTGTPRYADEVQDPPFHWYCRTSEALYNPAFEEFGIPTERMVDMAQLELDARELTGKRVAIYPSHATARRAGALPSG